MPAKILIIEDSPDVREALKLLIEMEGYEVAVAMNGAEALERATSEKPDLVLMDLVLPDTSGLDLTREMRSYPDMADVPILCVSSYAEGIESVVRAAGCQEVFSKTAFIKSFRATLKKYLGE